MSMSLKFMYEIDFTTFDNLMEEDGHVYELSCLAFNINKEVVQVLDSFFSFLKKYEERKTHNMFFLMLNPRLKTLHLVSYFCFGQGNAIVEKYDNYKKIPMLLRCYYHLHPLVEYERSVIDQRVEKDMNLDIFEMTTNINEPTT
jgi:hypothetical protein